MTDYFGQVVELDVAGGAPTLDITDDRADALRQALNKLGYPSTGEILAGTIRWEGPLTGDGYPGLTRILFPQGTDADGLQDLLDELDYQPDGAIVRVVV